MPMKKIILITGILILIVASYSQSVRVEVSGLMNLKYIQLDSIKILNRRTLETKMKYYPDTTLYSSNVGIIENSTNATFGFTKNYQNPYFNQTEVTLNLIFSDNITIGLYDLSGKICSQFTQFLNSGTYKFNISAKNNGFYILKIQSSQYSSSIKLIQTATGDKNNQINLISEIPSEIHNKSGDVRFDDSDFFNIGDTLNVYGYYNGDNEIIRLIMNRNGYTMVSFGAQQDCDSIDLIGNWAIVSKSFYDNPIQDVYNMPIQGKLNFMNDTLVSSLKLEQYSIGNWFYGQENILLHMKYKLFNVYNNYNLSFYNMNTTIDENILPNFYDDFYFIIMNCNLLILTYSPNDEYQFIIFKLED